MLLFPSLFCMLLIPYCLPRMHERCFFVGEIVAVVYAFYQPRWTLAAVALQLIPAMCYLPFLFGRNIMDGALLALPMGPIVAIVGVRLVTVIQSEEGTWASSWG